MKVTYQDNHRIQTSNMAFEVTETEYDFKPQSNKDGLLHVFLKKNAGAWLAYLTENAGGTNSILDCRLDFLSTFKSSSRSVNPERYVHILHFL